ncbi:transcriptional regulator [Prauserella marina]|uniref:HTH marR-type domain-containing protein n=1 Tax=Prauserella marina TaxID=530584 RepID=A0A222VP53_9PSEU|nr:MarR family transcriptional regulator [Prauserella marina]ASR35632.1 transcriptional regulator [Prauserella marina]PWV84502.1 hypothetical protein DES30_101519 [Prauserella marina]SDC20820.1 hypothetical protein SAMN05421630_101817 [Prauserella marina]
MSATAEESFVNTIGDLLASWRLSHATGRVYGRLLLEPDPVSLDRLGSALGLSKGAISTAVRELVAWGLATTIPQAGSRRLLVEATGGLETLLAASHQRARQFIGALRDGKALAGSEAGRQRLDDVTDLFENYVAAGEELLRRRGDA